jgi:hypothetical protein
MRSLEARELMVERVQAAHAKWPRLEDMPSISTGWRAIAVNEAQHEVDAEKAYIKSLYAACYRGEPIGRSGMTIFVRKIEEKPI